MLLVSVMSEHNGIGAVLQAQAGRDAELFSKVRIRRAPSVQPRTQKI